MNGRYCVMLAVAAGVLCGFSPDAGAIVNTQADILFVVDESGSMYDEHTWLGTMITALESELVAAGVTDNRYGLVGFGASQSSHEGTVAGHKHTVGGGDWGTAAALSTAAGGLVATGGTEDGYEALEVALNYSTRSTAAFNVILITDEDRDDILSGTLDFDGVLTDLNAKNAMLNVVVNASFYDDQPAGALGVDSAGMAYLQDGSGYTTGTGGSPGTAWGTTIADYVDLAWDTGGAAWDLNQLRLGGDTAVSFTDAFVDIKVQEILIQSTPDGGTTILLLGCALLAMRGLRRRLVS